MPGELAIITATGLDSSGNKPYDYQDVGANGMLSTLAYLAPTSIILINGTKAKTVNAPMASGTWTITAYDVADRAYTATATVRNPSQEAADNSQAATDAAAEAADAANAATDAANAAAEAADAATAAAQDAADAVAALATQVTEQIDALKKQNNDLRKQLVALTNLIIKIQKKVKA
jgi:ABC-type transporter Mla subunit MlaD